MLQAIFIIEKKYFFHLVESNIKLDKTSLSHQKTYRLILARTRAFTSFVISYPSLNVYFAFNEVLIILLFILLPFPYTQFTHIPHIFPHLQRMLLF